MSKLFELCQHITSQLPAGSVQRFEDVYSFVYRNGRDLSGFIDGKALVFMSCFYPCFMVERGSFVIAKTRTYSLK